MKTTYFISPLLSSVFIISIVHAGKTPLSDAYHGFLPDNMATTNPQLTENYTEKRQKWHTQTHQRFINLENRAALAYKQTKDFLSNRVENDLQAKTACAYMRMRAEKKTFQRSVFESIPLESFKKREPNAVQEIEFPAYGLHTALQQEVDRLHHEIEVISLKIEESPVSVYKKERKRLNKRLIHLEEEQIKNARTLKNLAKNIEIDEHLLSYAKTEAQKVTQQERRALFDEQINLQVKDLEFLKKEQEQAEQRTIRLQEQLEEIRKEKNENTLLSRETVPEPRALETLKNLKKERKVLLEQKQKVQDAADAHALMKYFNLFNIYRLLSGNDTQEVGSRLVALKGTAIPFIVDIINKEVRRTTQLVVMEETDHFARAIQRDFLGKGYNLDRFITAALEDNIDVRLNRSVFNKDWIATIAENVRERWRKSLSLEKLMMSYYTDSSDFARYNYPTEELTVEKFYQERSLQVEAFNNSFEGDDSLAVFSSAAIPFVVNMVREESDKIIHMAVDAEIAKFTKGVLRDLPGEEYGLKRIISVVLKKDKNVLSTLKSLKAWIPLIAQKAVDPFVASLSLEKFMKSYRVDLHNPYDHPRYKLTVERFNLEKSAQLNKLRADQQIKKAMDKWLKKVPLYKGSLSERLGLSGDLTLPQPGFDLQALEDFAPCAKRELQAYTLVP